MNLSRINELDVEEAAQTFLRCCGSESWAQEMAHGLPYASDSRLAQQAEAAWNKLAHQDWLEAFAAHPKIGDVDSLRHKYSSTKNWAEGEQSGVGGASDAVLTDLAAFNQAYEEKFGYIFIVCATGKTAGEMLSLLQKRILNPPEEELKIAIEEQKKITHLRLEKL